MLYSYNWLKWYIPDAPEADKLADIITYHIAEVENVKHSVFDKKEDWILDIKILPNRAHDLLSHLGIARELGSLLNINFVDPTSKYKIPESKPTKLKITIDTEKCRRYMGRIIRGVKVGPSPEWIVKHLESIGQRSINNMVDAANLVMFDCGQPTHVFDLNKTSGELIVREAKNEEELTTLDNKELKLKNYNVVIADSKKALAVAGVKGGKIAEVDNNTKDIILEIANFDPISVRKTAQYLNIFTDARKRFENDLSPELAPHGMRELSALILEMCPGAIFEDIVDVYSQKQEERKLLFNVEKISKILGANIDVKDVTNIFKRYNFFYTEDSGIFTIAVPAMRLDLEIEEDMAEEIGRIMGYDKVKPKIPGISFIPKTDETYAKISWARNQLLSEGYSEVMTYTFCDKGEVEVMQSASDKKFLRTNLSDGLKESLKLNSANVLLLGMDTVKIFEIGTVWCPNEEIHVSYFGDTMPKPEEMKLEDYCKNIPSDVSLSTFHFQPSTRRFAPWSLFPFIVRDIAVWVPEGESEEKLKKILKENATNLLIKEPYIFDSFTKEGKTSYAFRLVFQSYDRTLTDAEINEIMSKITNKIKDKKTNGIGWQVR